MLLPSMVFIFVKAMSETSTFSPMRKYVIIGIGPTNWNLLRSARSFSAPVA